MRLRDPRLWLGVATSLGVVALVWLDRERTSPGPLSPVHERVAELAGSTGCARCHGGLARSMASACAECHGEIDAQIAANSGFHGTLQNVDTERCSTCHAEHHGAELELAGPRSFELSGFQRTAYAHENLAGFQLTGRHAALACDACHPHAESAVLAAGEKRFLGLAGECTSCHADPHQGKFARSCNSCHGQELPFAAAASFVHTERFPLAGAHAIASCNDCHAPEGAYAIEIVGGSGPFPPERACVDCHASPHAERFLVGVARLANVDAGESCGACHAAERGAFAADSPAMPRELHAASGFELGPPHERALCSDCHFERRDASDFPARYPGRKADDCSACHEDPHRRQFESGAFAGQGCVACHDRGHFAPPAFGVEQHGRTAFALTGAHQRTDCADCHSAVSESARVFAGTSARCESCHRDVHRGAFAEPIAAGGCAACHGTESFADLAPDRFDHARDADFALAGAHARAQCSACHPPGAHPALPERSFGFAAERFDATDFERCEACHADPHAGVFARAAELEVSARGCAACHGQEAFGGERERDFDHGRFTGFELAGAHARASCESCHGSGEAGSARSLGLASARFSRAAGSPGSFERCETCHDDPHAGRFAERGTTDCASCHGLESFTGTVHDFDHVRWTGFALEGAHAGAACAACHVPTPADSAVAPASGTRCADCHADPHAGQFTQAGATDCARCHGTTSFERLPGFDHARDTRFALDATHAALACAACHRPYPSGSGREIVRYKPLGTRCGDCHGLPPGGGGR